MTQKELTAPPYFRYLTHTQKNVLHNSIDAFMMHTYITLSVLQWSKYALSIG